MQSDTKSRTQLKNEAAALQALGRNLTALSPNQLSCMGLSEELYQAVLVFQKMTKHGARRRQLQYIGTLMRASDAEPICRKLESIAHAKSDHIAHMHQIESWRDALAAGDSDLLQKLPEQYPHTNRQRLNQLVRNARKEFERNSPGKSTRSLFEYLKAIALDDPKGGI